MCQGAMSLVKFAHNRRLEEPTLFCTGWICVSGCSPYLGGLSKYIRWSPGIILLNQATAWALESRQPTMLLHRRWGRWGGVGSTHKVKQRIRSRKELLLLSVPENMGASEGASQFCLFILACSRTVIPECYFGHGKPDGPGTRCRGEVLEGSDEPLRVSSGGVGSAQIKEHPRANVS